MKTALTQALEALEKVALDAAMQALAMAKTMSSDAYNPQRLKSAHDDIDRANAAIAACRAALAQPDNRPCTCHPDDNPPQPCAKRYALGECREQADATPVAQPDDAQDARRYRHIRRQFAPLGLSADGNHAWAWRGSPDRLLGASLDLAIDAAIAAQGEA